MPRKHHIEVEGRELTISNVEKVYFPSSDFTKGQVISFYSEIAEVILPYLRDRLLTLKRIRKESTASILREERSITYPVLGEEVRRPPQRRGFRHSLVLCNDRATLVRATNLADIEKHALLAVAPDLNRPTSLFATWILVTQWESWIAVAWRCT
jgi:bifunctional non-homologous end joining protein LigD